MVREDAEVAVIIITCKGVKAQAGFTIAKRRRSRSVYLKTVAWSIMGSER